MRRVAEVMYIVEEERAAFIEGATHPDIETQKVLWLCGVRRQQYFAMSEMIFMTFEYEGTNFAEDMSKMASYLDSKGLLIKHRRKDVPVEDRATTSWWAPVKRLGNLLEKNPGVEDEKDYNLVDLLDGSMSDNECYNDLSYDEEDWA